ncbi:MAG: ABC transporter permease, partial [Lachnospiraceae bacterium]|nr:ABC transporter permease [Lachnospiraceae bacterium]
MLKNNNSTVITKMAKHALTGNKRKNGILIFTVMLSAFMLFTILTVGSTWIHMQQVEELRLQGGDFDIFLYGGFSKEQEMISKNHPEIKEMGIVGMAGWGIKMERDDTLHSAFMWADETQWEKIQKPAREWVKGTYPQNANEVMATKDVLKDCGFENLDIGDSFTITYGDNLGEHTKEFVISGMWEGYGDKNVFYVSKSFFDQSGITLEDYGRGFLYLQLKPAFVTDKLFNNLENDLKIHQKQHLMLSSTAAASAVFPLLGMLGLIVITCLSAYLLIYNIMYLSISGNIRYYGLLQTIGMTPKQVYQLVKKQMQFIGAIGIGIGLLLGIFTSFGLIPVIIKSLGAHNKNIEIMFHPFIILMSILLTAATVKIGSRKPAKMATQSSPMEALGYRRISVRKQSRKFRKDKSVNEQSSFTQQVCAASNTNIGGLAAPDGRSMTASAKNKYLNRRIFACAKINGLGRNGSFLWKMARERICKDKKRTAMVIGSLGISLSVFLCMVTLIESQGPRTIVSNYMETDLIVKNDTMQMTEKSKWKPLIDDSFLQKLQTNEAVKGVHSILNEEIVIPWDADFMEYWMANFYDIWMEESYQDIKGDYQKHPEKYYSFLIGIDKEEFQYLNSTLEHPVKESDFLEGKSCILYKHIMELDFQKVKGKTISYYLYDNQKQTCQMTIQGMTGDNYYANLLGTTPSLIVSDTFLKKITQQPNISKVSIQYKQEYDKETENSILNLIEDSRYKKDFSYDSKIEELELVTKAQGSMMGIGMGITLILAFIGIMNYVNTSVSNLQSSQTELSIMESIGMTGRQLRKLLIHEGILFAAGALLFSITAGLPITYYLYQFMNYRGIPFQVPVLPLVTAVFVIML